MVPFIILDIYCNPLKGRHKILKLPFEPNGSESCDISAKNINCGVQ
jgi:hypothetical protein